MGDPAKIVVILNLEAPRSVKQLRATLGHTRYYRKFIKGYAQITMPMEKILNKDVTFCWNEDCKKNLDILKENMVTAPILVFSDWKEFHVHVNASCIALGVVLTQAGREGFDHPIAFRSRILSKAEKNYSTTECEGLAMMYALQKFRHYLLGGHFKMYMDHSTLKYLINKPMLGGESAGTTPEGYTVQQKKELVVCAADFSVIVGHLYKMGSDEILRQYVPEFSRSSILADAHGGVVKGHYAGGATVENILRAGLWWPTLHQDSKAYCKACDVCQRIGKPSQRDEKPLNPQMTLQPFERWAIDFVGPIQPQGKTGARYIITVMKYLTRWVEAQPVKDCTGTTTVNFLFEHVVT
eukprot:PITA_26246